MTKKAVIGVVKCLKDPNHVLYMGNLDALRDWGHAKDYVEGMHKILQHEKPDDFVLPEKHILLDMLETAFAVAGKTIHWEGSGLEERGYIDGNRCVIKIDSRYFRPLEVNILKGNPTKVKETLGWEAKYTFDELIKEMVEEEIY